MKSDKMLRRIEDYIRGVIQLKLEALGISFEELCDTPPEFDEETLSDPVKYKSYRAFLSLKETYKNPVGLAILYLFEYRHDYKVLEMYAHDLVAGQPAWEQGISGRDIDYVIVMEKLPPRKLVEDIENYLDDLVGEAITNYFFKKKGCTTLEPFNRVIKHNLIELHVIPPSMKSDYGINSIFSVPVERLDIEGFRRRIKELRQSIEKLGFLEEYMH